MSNKSTSDLKLNWLTKTLELNRGGSEANVRPMEGLRGFAVFLVFLVHYVALMLPLMSIDSAPDPISVWLVSFGGTGVDLFFVLSGYLIYGSLISRPQPFLSFMHRRIRRIYPAFTTVFVLYIALSFLFPSEDKIPRPLAAGVLFLVQNFLLLPGIFHIPAMITVAWSLSYEVFYYLVIPLLIAMAGLRERSPRWRVAFFGLLSTVVAVYCARTGGPIRLIMFGAGVLLFEATRRDRRSISGFVGVLAIAAAAAASVIEDRRGSGLLLKQAVLFGSYATLCLVCFSNSAGWLARSFSWTPLRWLGNISYSYYLIHGLALKGVAYAISVYAPGTIFPWWMYWAFLPPLFVLTLVPSMTLFLIVERPFSLAQPRRVRPENIDAARGALQK